MTVIDYGKARRANRARRNRAAQTKINHNGYLFIVQKDQRTGWQPHYQFLVAAIREGIGYGPVAICMPTQHSFSSKADAIKYGRNFIDERVSSVVYSWLSVGAEVAVA